jgi:hypothetical protein
MPKDEIPLFMKLKLIKNWDKVVSEKLKRRDFALHN